MRNKLKEYIPLSEKERNTIWKKGVFVLDANVLLNICRYSKKSGDELIAIIRQHKDSLWLPYQVGMEFFNNRLSVIESIRNGFNALLKNIDNIENILVEGLQIKKFRNETAHNIEQLRKDFNNFRKREASKIKKWQKEFEESDKEAVLDEILNLYEGKVGDDYDESNLKTLYLEGERRQKENIPPGYADWKDKIKEGIRNACGDLIWWKQAIDYARDKKRNLIIVTDDKKEDWWYSVSGQIKGPRVELIREFDKETNGQKFLMYKTHQFMEIAKQLDGASVSDSSIKEVKETGSLDYRQLFDMANNDFNQTLNIVNDPNNQWIKNIGSSGQTPYNYSRQFVSPDRVGHHLLDGSYNSLYAKSIGAMYGNSLLDFYKKYPEEKIAYQKLEGDEDSFDVISGTKTEDNDKK